MKISFIGAGTTSCATAYTAGLKYGNKLNEIVLVGHGENNEKPHGRAVDVRQGLILNGLDTKVIGTIDFNDIKGSDVVVMTASCPPPSGISNRESMLRANLDVVEEVANKLKAVIPTDEQQPLIIVLTNPLDLIMEHFIKVGGFNKKKTIGSGNWLDVSRFQDHLARATGIAPSKIKTIAIGQHGAKMVYLLSKTTLDGKPLSSFNIPNLDEIVNKSITGAKEIVELGKIRTTFGPAMSMFALIDAYINDTKSLLTACVYLNGEYGVKDFTFGAPIILGKNGVEKIEILEMSEDEKQKYKESYEFTLGLRI